MLSAREQATRKMSEWFMKKDLLLNEYIHIISSRKSSEVMYTRFVVA